MKLRIVALATMALVCLGGFLGIQCLLAEEQSRRWPDAGPDAVPFEDVDFTFSSDPTVRVLSLVITTGRTVRETLIYGDGRVELQQSNLWGPIEDLKTTVQETHQLLIPYEEVAALVRIAAIHGLVESDPNELEAKRKGLGTRQIRSTSTSYRLTVALESYARGPISLAEVEKAVWARNAPFLSRQYPEILEYAGLRDINAVVESMWGRARKERDE